MRIQIVSDLHLELPQPDYQLPDVGASVRVLAGDIHNGVTGIRWAAAQQRAGLRTFYVPGNHEYYNQDFDLADREMRAAAEPHGIDLLNGDVAVIESVRFIGASLWTDFSLLGDQAAAMETARQRMSDYRAIRDLAPEQVLERHTAAQAWLEEQLATAFPGPTIVVTHHAPHPESVPPRHRGHPLSPAYASDLSTLITRYQPDIWIHGHIHHRLDYHVGETRVICNPRGYYPSILNPGFDPGLVIES